MLSGCANFKSALSKQDVTIAPKGVEAKYACPFLPSDIRAEAKRYTEVPVEDLTKAQVLNLFRKYATAEVRKNYSLTRVANLYDSCRGSVIK